MKLLSPSRRRPAGFIEPLEARVAPAAIINIGFPVNGGTAPASDTLYKYGSNGQPPVDLRPAPYNALSFVPTYAVDPVSGNLIAASDPISQAVDEPGTSNTYYLKLSAGDTVHVYSSVGSSYGDPPPGKPSTDNANVLIDVLSGSAVAFFTDSNNDNHYEEGEFTGLALSANASVEIHGQVYGSVVTDLAPDGTIHTGDLVSPKQGIKSLVVGGGSIFGDVLSGGNISELHVTQGVNNVLAGTAANGAKFDFFQLPDPANPGQFLQRFTIGLTEAAGQVGSSISNVQVGFLGSTVTTIGDSGPVSTFIPGVLHAGDGGAGAKGGSLTNVSVINDDQQFSLLAGAGGAAASGKPNGGAGGNISNVVINGVADLLSDPLLPNPHANDMITIQGGAGGAGSTSGIGGAGGSLSSIFVGYDSATTVSASLSADDVSIDGGQGGIGKTGGAGGSLTTVKVRVATPLLNGDEVTIFGGDGGASDATSAGASGKGGSLTNLDVRNQVDTTGSIITIHGGDAGATTATAKGGAGGSVTTAALLGFDLSVIGGDGAAGKTGGAGGSVGGITVLSLPAVDPVNDIINQNGIFDGGIGGAGSAGNGGAGGAVKGITAPLVDYASLLVDDGIHGNGGASVGGRGGAGGAVSNIIVNDIDHIPGDPVYTLSGVATLRAGDGGAGSKGGGIGGAFSVVSVTSFGLVVTGNSGSGGASTVSGPGGAGGALSNVSLNLSDNFELTNQNGVSVSGALFAGAGGAGLGTGVGGAGGNANLLDVITAGNASVTAGVGGAGQISSGDFKGTAAGRGGSVLSSNIVAQNGAGVIRAGDAGAAGVGAAAGGAIIGGTTKSTLVGLRALTDVTLVAGNGSGGGAGGAISNVTYGVSPGFTYASTALDEFGDPILEPVVSPLGNILIQAGDGSAGAKGAGAGGSVTGISGSVSSGVAKLTSIQAGDGDGNAKFGSSGGSVTNITISGGGAPQLISDPIEGITVSSGGALPGIFKIAAGDAGNSTGAKVGGKGGNVSQVQVIGLDIIPDPTGATAGTLAPFGQQTDFQSVAAGNGGDASTTNGKGGPGGTISGVRVQNHDIGLRTGAVFGYNSAGGLFAGVGGSGNTSGANGSVTEVNANGIASIVAGRTLTPQMATSVDHILVNDNTQLLTQKSFVLPGAYTLSYGADTTAPLPAGATAQQVQNALNALPSIQASGTPQTPGGVTVSYGQQPGTYIVLFASTGAQVAFSGTEQVIASSNEQIAGASTVVPVIETTAGGQPLPVVIAQAGQFTIPPIETVRGEIDFTASTLVQGDVNAGINAVETFNVAQISKSITGRFTLSFQGVATNSLPGNSSAAAIGTALNGLSTIAAAGGVVVQQGFVNGVVAPGVFVVTFTTAGDQSAIIGSILEQETQNVNVSALASLPNGSFTLSFSGSSTAALPAASTAATVQTALNKLPNIAVAGGVTVTNVLNGSNVPIPGDFNITFGSIGEKPLLGAVGDTNQTQSLDLSPVQGDVSPANVTFTVGAGVTAQTTVGLSVNATAAQIQTALNKLSSITAAGGVTVLATSAHTFSITFGKPGAAPSISPTANVMEVQTLDVSSVDHLSTGQFALTFGASTTPFLPGNATAAQIATALNALPSVQATGPNGAGGTVSVVPSGSSDQFVVTFAAVGEQSLIVGAGAVGEQQSVEVYAPVVGQQAANFTLSFDGATTGIINGGASASVVSAALNKLGPIVAAGGVTVTAQNSLYTIAFTTPGVQQPLITGVETETLGVTTLQAGSNTQAAVEQISASPTTAFAPVQFAAANLVGAIYDINARDANVFHYLHDGVPATGNFQIGDTPIDGIVMAQTFNQSTVNFTPEAEFTSAGFFDNDNIL